MKKVDENNIDDILDDMIDEEVEDKVSTIEDFENSELFDENKIPDNLVSEDNSYSTQPILAEREKLQLGLTPEDIKDLYDYMSGKAEKPLFIDRFTSDTEGRLKDMTYMMNLLQMSSLPMLIALQSQVREKLYSRENLMSMDVKDLSASSANLTKEINSILSNSINTVQTFSSMGSLNSEYRKLLDRLMLLPEDKVHRLMDILNEEEK